MLFYFRPILLLLVLSTLGSVAFAGSINELCKVTEVRSNDFGNSLEASSDETLSFIGFSNVGNDEELTIGGFSFFNEEGNRDTEVRLLVDNGNEVRVSLKSRDFGNFEYKSLRSTGCAYITKAAQKNNLKVVAVANCRYQNGKSNPTCSADVPSIERKQK